MSFGTRRSRRAGRVSTLPTMRRPKSKCRSSRALRLSGERTMKFNKAMIIAALCAVTTGAVYAKLPTPQLNDEQKATAEEAKAKAADAAKKEGELLAKSQDRVADHYISRRRRPKA